MRMTTLVSVSVCVLAAIGCAPADVAGNYAVSLSNGENTCGIDGWDPAGEATGVQVAVTQVDADVRLQVTDLASSLILNALLGDATFTGTVSGNHVSADILGTVDRVEGGCTYRLTANLEGDLNGDALSGDIAYVPQDYECFPPGCENLQAFSGSRPPRE